MLLLSALTLISPLVFEEPRTAAEPALLARVAVVGASMSSGAGVSIDGTPKALLEGGVPLAEVLAAASLCDTCSFKGHHDVFFFGSPMKTGPKLLEQALASEPTLVVALDFLFWFGYGAGGRDGKPLESEEGRLLLLEEGLALLEQVKCPLVIGDLPDMSPAVGKMIMPNQMPKPETLAGLNERIHAWAAERPHVVVVSLAEAVLKMRSNEAFTLAGRDWPAGSATGLMQRDELHPTLEGVVAVLQIAVYELVAAELAREQDFRLDVEAVRQRLAQRAAAKKSAPPVPEKAGAKGG